MEALEKAKLALRKYLLENKEKVAADLDAMRKKSEGKDIFNYIENLSDAFSFECVTSSIEITYDLSFQEIDCYNLQDALVENLLYSPPNKIGCQKTRKGSEIFSESFFFIILHYVRSKKSCIFV